MSVLFYPIYGCLFVLFCSFDSPQDSIEAYMLNLNTHRAYQRMRQKCAVFRQQNKKPTGWDLAKTLDKYSERGNG